MHTDSLDMIAPDLSFQHYKVLRQADGSPWELGRGSMGITYKAFDVNLCCEVALKVINAATLEHPHARERFVSEARAAAKLRHRNIASVYHLGNDGQHYFYAMEFVDGETLDALVRRQGPLPVATALRILLQAARALAAATRQGLVHRDLKPANIMVTHEDADDELLVKVIDFGLAKPIHNADGLRPLTFGGFVGTPQYASPEQLEERPVDGRSDIYSLGATTWFLLTGRAPFVGPLASICRQHLMQPPPWSQLPKPFPETARTLLGHMLEKDPLRRPTDAVELRRQIEASLEVIREPSTGLVPVQQKFVAKAPNWFRPRVSRPAGTVPPSEGEAPRTGMILKGRYELLRLVGEGNSGRVFLARDRGANEALAAIKVLHAELIGTAAERDRLGEEVRLIQEASHPQLTRILSLDTLLSQETVFLVEEWLHGFTLLDFLAVRGGALPVEEALRLLEQAAAVADHAENRRLERLDFALHQFHLHFPVPAGNMADDPDAARAPMQTLMAQWPAWTLKLNPLGALRKGLEASTWAGDVTLIPGGPASASADNAVGRSSPAVRDLYTRGVAQLVYELLGGAPASPVYAAERQSKYVSLPALNEEANAVLQRALSESAAFADATEFYTAIGRASGRGSIGVPVAKGFHAPAVLAARHLPLARSRVETGAASVERPGTFADENDTPTLLVPTRRTGSNMVPRTDVTFGADGEPVPARGHLPSDEMEESSGVWDRLALVSGEGTASRLWVGGVILSFVLLLVGSIAFLKGLNHRPAHKLSSGTTVGERSKPKGKSFPSPARLLVAAKPVAAPTIPMTVAATLVPPPDASARLLSTPVPRPYPAAVAEPDAASPDVAATTIEPNTTPLPLNPPLHDQPVRVHVTSKPPGVEVLSKGKVIGSTPFDANLPAGDYQLVARYKTWPEVHQALRVTEGQQNASTELHMMPPALVPLASAAASPLSRSRRAQQDEVVRRNFVRSTRGDAGSSTDSVQTPAATEAAEAAPSPEARRVPPKLHPFDPNGVFRPTAQPPPGD